MVRNEGEPGEDLSGGRKMEIYLCKSLKALRWIPNLMNSRRFGFFQLFNPVDLVCAVKDFRGIPFL